jgi:hypothetical protein
MDHLATTRDSTLALVLDWIGYLFSRRLRTGGSACRAIEISAIVALSGNPPGG